MAAKFVIDWSDASGDKENAMPAGVNLQEAFRKFRKERQVELRRRKEAALRAEVQCVDREKMEALRQSFLEKVLSYSGVPYARRYHEPTSPTYHSKLFLDCCGLVRRALKDLKDEFGFTIGPGNQAYQFDTLPVVLRGPEEMRPGDLVFVSATYYNPKMKQQKHNLVHVEVWLGEGHKTVGARWQKRFVEIHDSYQFESKSYHSMQYHFRSIDTWLQGVCRSHCPEHTWQRGPLFVPGKRSVFALSDSQSGEEAEGVCQQEGEGQEACPQVEEEQDHSSDPGEWEEEVADSGNPPSSLEGNLLEEGVRGVSQPVNGCPRGVGAAGGSDKPHPLPGGGTRQAVKPSRLAVGGAKSKPKFYIGGKNGSTIIEDCLLRRGWDRIHDNLTTDFYLKWVELKSQIQYPSFKEGRQLVNHFPNIGLLTTKTGLLDSLRELSQSKAKQPPAARLPVPLVSSFYPKTYRLDVQRERSEFFSKYKEGERWICKPSGMNQGKGIFLVHSLSQLREVLHNDEVKATPTRRAPVRVIQKYIENPLLLKGRKFDIRAYMLLIAARPYVVLYHPGYLRLTCEGYQRESNNLAVHLTNQFVQKRQESYADMRHDTVWSFSQFQAYLSEGHLGEVPDDWVDSTLKAQMQSVMMACFRSVQCKLQSRLGFSDLLGFDFMVDDQFKVWLLEVNVNPAMHTNCEVLQELIPRVIQSTLDVTIDVFEKCQQGKPLPDLTRYGAFEELHK